MGNRGTLFDSTIGDRPFNIALTNNYDATTNPTASNDFSQGYRKGSDWLNVTTGQIFQCIVDTVGAAVWSTGATEPQATPIAHNAAVTLSVADMQNGLITSAPVAAIAFTTPTGAVMDAGVSDLSVGANIQFTIVDTATSADTVTLTAGASGITIVGNAVVTGGTSATFRAVRTAAATWTFYRIS